MAGQWGALSIRGIMKRLIIFVVLLGITQCKEEPKGKPVAFSEACSGKYWAKEVKGLYEGERIAIPGYLSASGMLLQNETLNLDLHENAGRTGKSITVSVRTHGGKNAIDKLDKTYKDGDLKIHTATGETVGSKDKVVVHAEHIGSPLEEQSCLFNVFMIEKG